MSEATQTTCGNDRLRRYHELLDEMRRFNLKPTIAGKPIRRKRRRYDMGKLARKDAATPLQWEPPSKAETRRRRKTLKFRKASKSEISKSLGKYHELLDHMKTLDLPPCDAVEMVREQRDKDYYKP